MESTSLASSFVDALTVHLKQPAQISSDDSSKSFGINPEADPHATRNLLWASSMAISHSMDMLGKLYANVILARRDAALAESSLKNPEAAAEMRVLPIDSRRLFGPAMESKLKERAEKAKEDRWCMPPPPPQPSPRPGRQQSFNRPQKSQNGQKRKPSFHGGEPHNPPKRRHKAPNQRFQRPPQVPERKSSSGPNTKKKNF